MSSSKTLPFAELLISHSFSNPTFINSGPLLKAENLVSSYLLVAVMKGKLQARDRILELPEHIIHDIMHHLSIKKVLRASVLSKTLHRLRRSYPVSYFNQEGPVLKSVAIPCRFKGWEPAKDFTERVHSSLLQFQQLDICFKELYICMHAFDSKLSKELRRCIRLALKLG